MGSTAYINIHTLTDGHSGTINALAFSPNGLHLASGSDDKTVIVWSVLKGGLLHRLFFDSCVDCVLWHPLREDTLIVACEDGSLEQVHGFSLTHNKKYPINFGVQATVHALDYHAKTGHLAAAIGTEVHVTREVMQNRYSSVTTLLPHPTEEFDAEDPRNHAVTVKFDQGGRRLTVTYLHHAVVCWDIETLQRVWSINPLEAYPATGFSATSPNDCNIVIHNFRDGLLSYFINALNQPKAKRTLLFDVTPNPKIALQAAFLHGGEAVVCGTSTGRVCVWQRRSGEFFQQLPHDGDVVPAIATTQRGDYSYIATGCAFKGAETYVKIWRARIPDVQQRRGRGSVAEAILDVVAPIRPLVIFDGVHPFFAVAILVPALMCVVWGALYAVPLVPWVYLGMVIRHLVSRSAETLGSSFALLRLFAHSSYIFILGSVALVLEYARLRLLAVLGVPPNIQEILDRLPPA